MFLHRIHLDPLNKEARRDLSDPYQLHSTLCRAFSGAETKCPEGEFLWRLEPETNPAGCPRVLVQGRARAEWDRIGVRGWMADADPAVDLAARLGLDTLQAGRQFRFRLRANPCVTRNGKRLGLMRIEEQEAWIERKGLQHGFSLPHLEAIGGSESSERRTDVRISQERMLQGNRHSGKPIRVFSVLFDGVLTVSDCEMFRVALRTGIGHGKALGLGLLSVAPVR